MDDESKLALVFVGIPGMLIISFIVFTAMVEYYKQPEPRVFCLMDGPWVCARKMYEAEQVRNASK